jgi:hypothetical protein
MHSDIHHSDQKGAKAANESSQSATSFPASNRLARRSFLRNLGMGAVLLAPGAALLGNASKALAAMATKRRTTPSHEAMLRSSSSLPPQN